MGILCDATACKNNTGGFCDKDDIYISEAETGEPICQDAEFADEENQDLKEEWKCIKGQKV